MPTKVKAVYEGGVFRPLEPLDLTEKTPVELTIEPLTVALLQQAAHLSVTHALLTNDTALLAHM